MHEYTIILNTFIYIHGFQRFGWRWKTWPRKCKKEEKNWENYWWFFENSKKGWLLNAPYNLQFSGFHGLSDCKGITRIKNCKVVRLQWWIYGWGKGSIPSRFWSTGVHHWGYNICNSDVKYFLSCLPCLASLNRNRKQMFFLITTKYWYLR